jgi:hypothetical protein
LTKSPSSKKDVGEVAGEARVAPLGVGALLERLAGLAEAAQPAQRAAVPVDDVRAGRLLGDVGGAYLAASSYFFSPSITMVTAPKRSLILASPLVREGGVLLGVGRVGLQAHVHPAGGVQLAQRGQREGVVRVELDHLQQALLGLGVGLDAVLEHVLLGLLAQGANRPAGLLVLVVQVQACAEDDRCVGHVAQVAQQSRPPRQSTGGVAAFCGALFSGAMGSPRCGSAESPVVRPAISSAPARVLTGERHWGIPPAKERCQGTRPPGGGCGVGPRARPTSPGDHWPPDRRYNPAIPRRNRPAAAERGQRRRGPDGGGDGAVRCRR